MGIHLSNKQATKSTFGKHRVGAVIVKNGRYLSSGYNSRQYCSEFKTHTRHAEVSAILKMIKAQRLNVLAGSTMYVSRFTKCGNTGLAKPCPDCHKLIQSVGIKQVFYTTDTTVKRYKV